MTTAKISSEKDSDVQVGAQAFAATSVEQRHSVLLAVSAGQTSITDAALELGLGDAVQHAPRCAQGVLAGVFSLVVNF